MQIIISDKNEELISNCSSPSRWVLLSETLYAPSSLASMLQYVALQFRRQPQRRRRWRRRRRRRRRQHFIQNVMSALSASSTTTTTTTTTIQSHKDRRATNTLGRIADSTDIRSQDTGIPQTIRVAAAGREPKTQSLSIDLSIDRSVSVAKKMMKSSRRAEHQPKRSHSHQSVSQSARDFALSVACD